MDISISKLERLPNGKVMGVAKLYVLYDSLDDECNTKDENLYIEFTFERKNGELNFSEFDINDESLNFYKAFNFAALERLKRGIAAFCELAGTAKLYA